MSDRLSISAIIVTYNRLDKLKKSFHAIQRQGVNSIVVVNNNSTDNTETWLAEQKDSRLQIINLQENTGGAGGFSTGIRYVTENIDADWVICFDDDAYPQENAIEQFEHYYSGTEIDIVAAAVYSMDGTILEMNRPVRTMPASFPEMLSYFANRNNFVVQDLHYKSQVPVEIDASSFVGMFIHSSWFRGIFGTPRNDLFLYCDDLIYTYSSRRNGARLVFDPRICFRHDCDNQLDRLYQNPWKVYYLVRNYTEFYRIVNAKQYLLMSIARTIYIISKITASNHKLLFLMNALKGIHDGVTRNFRNTPMIPPAETN